MDTDAVQAWLDRYVAAWRSNNRSEVEALFATEASYRWAPWADPIIGDSAIADWWLEEPDDPDSWEARYTPLSVGDDLVFAEGETRYLSEGKRYANLFVMRFDDRGRCTEFTDWYVRYPKSRS